jgi:FtsP/CotA-like multicopper oxidase with cupredoxin domain
MGPVFSINGESTPDVTPLVATLGTVEEWSLVNTTAMDHPFHLHGFRFQVVSSRRGRAGLLWPGVTRSTSRPTRQRSASASKITPASWMFHCHILEHAERGMMGELHVASAVAIRPSRSDE